MPAYAVFGLGAAVTIAASLLINKLILKNNPFSPTQYTLLFHAGGWTGVLLLLFAPVTLAQVVSVLPYAIVAGLFWILGDYFIFYSLKKIDASIVGSLFMFKILIIPIIAFAILQEVFSPTIYFLLLPLLLGGLLVTFDGKLHMRSFFRKEVLFVLLALFMFSIADIIGKFGIRHTSALSYSGVLAFVTALLSLSGLLFVNIRTQLTISRHTISLFTMLGSLVIVINTFLLLGIADNVTLTNAIAMLNAPFLLVATFILSQFKPKLVEHHPARVYAVRFVGAIIMYLTSVQIVMNS